MELLKKNIHMNRQKSQAVMQVTLEEDFNVPDSKADVGSIIQDEAGVKIEDMKVANGQVMVTGAMEVEVLYVADNKERKVHRLTERLPFEEQINMEGAETGDNVQLKWDIEDLSVSLINSRKLSTKALLTFSAAVEEIYDVSAAVELHGDGEISSLSKELDMLQLTVQKKDILRIKDEITLASNKPNIQEVLWKSIQLRGTDIRIVDGQLDIKGEFFIFVLYAGDDENGTMQWVETALPFVGTVDCSGCTPSMVEDVELSVASVSLEPRPDYDGEERILALEIVLDLDIKLYEEDKVEILEDVYSPAKELRPVTMQQVYESLVMKNFAKCRSSERVRMENNQPRMLQICHSKGDVKIDDTQLVDNGLKVEGAVFVDILYITSDDTLPFALMHGVVPFSHVIEVPGIDDTCRYSLKTQLEQLSTTMIDSEELEVKVGINLNALVVRVHKEDCIVDMEEAQLDMKKLAELPGIVGYIVQPGDSLWSIAKQYYTTPDRICRLNNLESEDVQAGNKLIIMKTVEITD